MPTTVFDAIQKGVWNYEPEVASPHGYDRTTAMPGTPEKVKVLAERLRNGLPLWHPADGPEDDER